MVLGGRSQPKQVEGKLYVIVTHLGSWQVLLYARVAKGTALHFARFAHLCGAALALARYKSFSSLSDQHLSMGVQANYPQLQTGRKGFASGLA